MLKFRVLKGKIPEKSFELREGENLVGRASTNQIVLNSSGVSKTHAKITVQGQKCVVTDLGSSNGTFVNGAKITDRIVRLGDRIAFHDIVVELKSEEIPKAMGLPEIPPIPIAPPSHSQRSDPIPPRSFSETMKTYLDETVLAGVYKINELYSMRSILGAFVVLFILFVTILSTIPMAQLTKDGVQKEAQRRALSIARNLASVAERAMATNNGATIRTDFAESEDGVTLAVVVSKEDGHIIAPLSKAQSYSNEEFVARARKHDETFVQQISSTFVGASVPIRIFSPEAGTQVTVAMAQIIYKMNSLDYSATVALFARILIIALILGSILYYFIYKIVVNPISDAAIQLDQALRGEIDIIKTKYDFDVFQKFVENINSALARMSHSKEPEAPPPDRLGEASNLVRIVSDAAFALDSEGQFLQVNPAFEEITSLKMFNLQGQTLEAILDQALKLNLQDLVSRAQIQPGVVVSSQLEIGGSNYDLDLQAWADTFKINYFFGTLKKRSAA